MIEQDMIISRALISMYSNNNIKNNLIFRGGTALNKLYLYPPSRYSEDLDFVQLKAGPIGLLIDSIRDALSWLGKPKTKRDERGFKMYYLYENIEGIKSKLKIEVNGLENFKVKDLKKVNYSVNSDWFIGGTDVVTYDLEELMGTKLRALFQRRKGRDLFDAWYVFSKGMVDFKIVVDIFPDFSRNFT